MYILMVWCFSSIFGWMSDFEKIYNEIESDDDSDVDISTEELKKFLNKTETDLNDLKNDIVQAKEIDGITVYDKKWIDLVEDTRSLSFDNEIKNWDISVDEKVDELVWAIEEDKILYWNIKSVLEWDSDIFSTELENELAYLIVKYPFSEKIKELVNENFEKTIDSLMCLDYFTQQRYLNFLYNWKLDSKIYRERNKKIDEMNDAKQGNDLYGSNEITQDFEEELSGLWSREKINLILLTSIYKTIKLNWKAQLFVDDGKIMILNSENVKNFVPQILVWVNRQKNYEEYSFVFKKFLKEDFFVSKVDWNIMLWLESGFYTGWGFEKAVCVLGYDQITPPPSPASGYDKKENIEKSDLYKDVQDTYIDLWKELWKETSREYFEDIDESDKYGFDYSKYSFFWENVFNNFDFESSGSFDFDENVSEKKNNKELEKAIEKNKKNQKLFAQFGSWWENVYVVNWPVWSLKSFAQIDIGDENIKKVTGLSQNVDWIKTWTPLMLLWSKKLGFLQPDISSVKFYDEDFNEIVVEEKTRKKIVKQDPSSWAFVFGKNIEWVKKVRYDLYYIPDSDKSLEIADDLKIKSNPWEWWTRIWEYVNKLRLELLNHRMTEKDVVFVLANIIKKNYRYAPTNIPFFSYLQADGFTSIHNKKSLQAQAEKWILYCETANRMLQEILWDLGIESKYTTGFMSSNGNIENPWHAYLQINLEWKRFVIDATPTTMLNDDVAKYMNSFKSNEANDLESEVLKWGLDKIEKEFVWKKMNENTEKLLWMNEAGRKSFVEANLVAIENKENITKIDATLYSYFLNAYYQYGDWYEIPENIAHSVVYEDINNYYDMDFVFYFGSWSTGKDILFFDIDEVGSPTDDYKKAIFADYIMPVWDDEYNTKKIISEKRNVFEWTKDKRYYNRKIPYGVYTDCK